VSDTSGQKAYSGSYDSVESQMVGNSGTLAPVDTTFSNVSTSNDVWVPVTGTVESGYSEPVAVILSMHDGSSTLSTQVDTVSMDRGSPESFAGSVAIGENDRGRTDVTIEVEASNLNGNVGIRNVTASLIGVPQHDHSVSTTSSTELGINETSTTALGINETSTTALGTNETSTTALGTNETSTTALGSTVSESSDASGDHTHPADPGIIEFGTETPSGCDLVVNGSTVATDIGSGAFETVIDVTGELNQGAWNDIEVTSDTLGHIQATCYVETYKQIGSGN